jgi:NIPSNAP
MNRRAFVAGSLVPALAPLGPEPGGSAGARSEGAAGSARPQLFELRSYHLRFGPMEGRFAEYAKGALIPALNRAGVKPVGAFTILVGPDTPSVTLLLPHPSAESLLALDATLEADADYRRTAGAFPTLPATDPPYARLEVALLRAFDSLPGIEAPAGPLAAPSRVFELRTYDSPTEAAGRKKVEMFEKAGEIALFRRVGLAPVFFGRNLAGPRLPGLTYMLVFPDLAGREKSWGVFRDDPEWVKLRSTAGFTNAEILTNVHNVLLRPTEYSQI